MGQDDAGTVRAAVGRYADRLHRALPGGHRVTSALGAWIVLAVAGPAATGDDRAELADVLGMPVEDARAVAAALLADLHPALAAAAATWVRERARTPRLDAWLTGLPPAVERGAVPSQAAADAWTKRRTLGLIDTFPGELGADTLIVLCSALATRVSWSHPFDLGAPFGAWRGPTLHADRGGSLLVTPLGDVGVHRASADGGLAVTSVIAPESASDTDVLALAHRIAGGRDQFPTRSLFDLPLGDGPFWTVTELDGTRGRERTAVRLPAWEAESRHDLMADDRTGFPAAARAVTGLLAVGGGAAARQVAMARYGRVGFEAAAVTAMAVAVSAAVERPGRERRAELRFAHPHAVVATACASPTAAGRTWNGLPVFDAWVERAVDAEA